MFWLLLRALERQPICDRMLIAILRKVGLFNTLPVNYNQESSSSLHLFGDENRANDLFEVIPKKFCYHY